MLARISGTLMEIMTRNTACVAMIASLIVLKKYRRHNVNQTNQGPVVQQDGYRLDQGCVTLGGNP